VCICLRLCLQTLQYDLLPNGGSIAVTASNRLLYVYLLADWHLNTRLGRAADAFASEW
jgi:ubiquitin-protein ligase E3 B/ubiquitin-protein ligase E3 C